MLFDHLQNCRFTNTEVPSVFRHLADELSLETRQKFQDELDLNKYHNPYTLEEERKIITNCKSLSKLIIKNIVSYMFSKIKF